MLANPDSNPPRRRPPYGIYAYTAREWDPEIGLYYYRARYYDPKIGRFLSEDPMGLDDGPNVYAYVENSPVNFTDPTGMSKALGNFYRMLHYMKHPPKPPWQCFIYCIPSVYFDDIIALGAGAAASRLPWAICKRGGKFVMKRVVPALAVLNLPTYLVCLVVCEQTEREKRCKPAGEDSPPCDAP